MSSSNGFHESGTANTVYIGSYHRALSEVGLAAVISALRTAQYLPSLILNIP